MLKHGKMATPIREMMADGDIGRVIFQVRDFRHAVMAQSNALNFRRRYGYSYTTHIVTDHRVDVVKNDSDSLRSIYADLTVDDD